MFKRAKELVAMRQKTLKLRTRVDGVLAGCLLTYFFWGSILLQCGDVERNPGPPPDLRQTSLTNMGRTRTDTGRLRLSSTSATAQPPDSFMQEVTSMLHALNAKVDGIQEDITDIRNSIGSLRDEMHSLKDEVADLRRENDDLKRRMQEAERKADDLEGRSKRNNLLFYGLPRGHNESPADCEGVLNDIIVDKLDLTGEFQFDRVHRLNGRPDSPVIARCTFYKDKEAILKAKNKLKGSSVFVGEDFTYRVRDIRRKLTPHLKKAKSEGKRATMVYDHLLIEGKRFYLGEGNSLRETV